jgi:hypothetical protein
MFFIGKWMFATAVLTGVLLLSQTGAACTKTIGGKSVVAGGAFLCDCTNGGSGCGCVVDDPSCGSHGVVQE